MSEYYEVNTELFTACCPCHPSYQYLTIEANLEFPNHLEPLGTGPVCLLAVESEIRGAVININPVKEEERKLYYQYNSL